MGHTLLVFLTSRWTEAAVLLLWIIALATGQRWLVFIAMVLAAAVVAALIGVFIARRYRQRTARTLSPDKPDGRDETRK